MIDQLQRAINLVKKTGDKLLIFDRTAGNNEIFAVMSLDDYENLALNRSEVRGLTEEELLDKINRDIAIWKSEQDFYGNGRIESGDFNATSYLSQRLQQNNEEPPRIIPEREQKKEMRKRWSIPEDRKEAAEEIIEEDRHYLEEIIF